ncbi:MAG: anthranilate synthase component I family protein [Candidatus Zixiibacteriota bacterium]
MNIFDVLADQPPKARYPLDLEELDLPGDLETPVSAFMKLQSVGARFLLESAEDAKSAGRYTFIGIDPLLRIEIRDQDTLVSSASGSAVVPHSAVGAPFDGLKLILDRFETSSRLEMPLLGGIVGFTSYDIVKFFEPKLQGLLSRSDWPLGLFYFVDKLLVFDHYMRRMKLVRLRHRGGTLHSGKEPVSLEQVRSTLAGERVPNHREPAVANGDYRSNFSPADFEAMVLKVKEHIVKGDIFQAVVSQCERRQSAVDCFQVYRALRMLNPSPYMYYLDFDDIELVGSSPEALVKLRDGLATARPIAGTRRRGRTPDDDHRLAEELLHNEKERAEHVMLIDLARNDLGRVCKFGTVSVPSRLQLEMYSHVMHLTSTVTGKLRSDCDHFDLFRATFPAGTVSGAPKLRAMEIIAEQERSARGPYAGSVGYFSLSGDFDMCITIRTIIRRNGELLLQGGAGIVADSIPAQEHLETRNKIAVLKRAIADAEEGRL